MSSLHSRVRAGLAAAAMLCVLVTGPAPSRAQTQSADFSFDGDTSFETQWGADYDFDRVVQVSYEETEPQSVALPFSDIVFEYDLEPVVRLVQATQAPSTPTPQPTPAAQPSPGAQPSTATSPASTRPTRSRRRRLTRAPAMYGDFYGNGTLTAAFTAAPITINQVWSDGSPFDTFVTNPVSGPGADIISAVPIVVTDVGSNTILTTSTSIGIDNSGDGQADTYSIAEPMGSAPAAPGPGAVSFGNGLAIFGGTTPATAADGSVGTGDMWNLVFSHTFQPAAVVINLPTGGSAVRRLKISENNSPQPRDRLIFDYSFFNDVIGGIGDVNRYSFGFEKTFARGMSSIQLTLPLAWTLANDQVVNGFDPKDVELGNLTAVLKTILYQGDDLLFAGGLGLSIPTARDTRLVSRDHTTILAIENETVHFLPYVAVLSTPSDRFFWQSFLQLDIDGSGNTVFGDLTGTGLNQIGVLQDQTLLFADINGGYWLYQVERHGQTSGLAAIAELHYSTTLDDADVVTGDGLAVGSFTNRFDVLNLTLGLSMLWDSRLAIRPAIAIPLREDDDEQFDFEALVQVNLLF